MNSLLWNRPQIQVFKNRLNSSITVMPLLHQWAHLAWQVRVVVFGVQQLVQQQNTAVLLCGLHSAFQCMNTSLWGGSLPTNPRLNSLRPATKVQGAFSNRIVLPSYGGRLRAMVELGELAQQVKVLATKFSNLSSMPGTHGKRNNTLKLSSDLYMCPMTCSRTQ